MGFRDARSAHGRSSRSIADARDAGKRVERGSRTRVDPHIARRTGAHAAGASVSGTHDPPARATSRTGCRQPPALGVEHVRRSPTDRGSRRAGRARRTSAPRRSRSPRCAPRDRSRSRPARTASSSAWSARGRVTVCSVKRIEPAIQVAGERGARQQGEHDLAHRERVRLARPDPGAEPRHAGDALATPDLHDLDRAALDHARGRSACACARTASSTAWVRRACDASRAVAGSGVGGAGSGR